MVEKSNTLDTLIIGGGIIGSSVAFHLALEGVREVVVVDPDLEGRFSSTELNAGGVRATMSHEDNIRLSKRSIEYFESLGEGAGYRPVGYLWLHSPEKIKFAEESLQLQSRLGWRVDRIARSELKHRFPLIDKTDGIAEGFFAPKDGLVNPNLIKNHFREEAKKRGVKFLDRLEFVGYSGGGSSDFTFEFKKWGDSLKDETVTKLSEEVSAPSSLGERVPLRAQRVVNCAGAWAPIVSERLGSFCPSKPVRKQIALFEGRGLDLSAYGMMIDPSGVYFHPEATFGLAGISLNTDPEGYRFDYEGDRFFEEQIWPHLYERSTQFENLRHKTGWAGLYEVSPDHSAILGEAKCRDRALQGRVFEAHSFSGHGIMQCQAAGESLAELMVGKKNFKSGVDLARFSVGRFEFDQSSGRWIPEGWVI